MNLICVNVGKLKLMIMRNKSVLFLSLVWSVLLVSCMSLVKADRLVYAGSIGKKVDAAIIDSISKIDISNDTQK